VTSDAITAKTSALLTVITEPELSLFGDNTPLKMYSKENIVDKLITQSPVVDFESAISLCLSTKRYADAILAIRRGSELLQRNQKTYLGNQNVSPPYSRVYQSIVTSDLSDIVQNANRKE
jgi:protein transport protein SEC31